MATMNFSVPDELKERFNAAFASENKSAVIARLMRVALEERERSERRRRARDGLLGLRRAAEPVTDEDVRDARQVGRF